MQPHMLYATSRQTDSILGWDIRGDTSIPLQEFERPGLTNQRLNFDVDLYGTTMVTGDKVREIAKAFYPALTIVIRTVSSRVSIYVRRLWRNLF